MLSEQDWINQSVKDRNKSRTEEDWQNDIWAFFAPHLQKPFDREGVSRILHDFRQALAIWFGQKPNDLVPLGYTTRRALDKIGCLCSGESEGKQVASFACGGCMEGIGSKRCRTCKHYSITPDPRMSPGGESEAGAIESCGSCDERFCVCSHVCATREGSGEVCHCVGLLMTRRGTFCLKCDHKDWQPCPKCKPCEHLLLNKMDGITKCGDCKEVVYPRNDGHSFHLEERSRQRREGRELVGIVQERYPEGAGDSVDIWRFSGFMVWQADRRVGADRRVETPEHKETP